MKAKTLLPALATFCFFFAVNLTAFAQTYTWSTIVGSGGISGTNDGIGGAGRFLTPMGITVDNTTSNLFAADFGNNTIRKLTFNPGSSNWSVTTVAGVPSNANDNDGNGTSATFGHPPAILAASPSLLYVLDQPATAYGYLRQMTFNGSVWQTVTLSVARSVTGSFGLNSQPSGVVLDSTGALFVTLASNNSITMVTSQGQNLINTVIAGNGNTGSADGTNAVARFNAPFGIAVDAANNLFVADTGNHTIRKISRVLNTTNWITTTIAGQVGNPGNVDGTNAGAQFSSPAGLAVDATSGNLLVADQNNNTIRKLTPQGTNWVVTTIGGQASHGTNDGVGLAGSFYHPVGLAVDNAGRVFVADYLNHTIRLGIPSLVSNPPPALQIATAGGSAFVIWPASATGCTLQATTNLNSGPWLTVTGGISTNLVFSGPMTNAQRFYRLTQP